MFFKTSLLFLGELVRPSKFPEIYALNQHFNWTELLNNSPKFGKKYYLTQNLTFADFSIVYFCFSSTSSVQNHVQDGRRRGLRRHCRQCRCQRAGHCTVWQHWILSQICPKLVLKVSKLGNIAGFHHCSIQDKNWAFGELVFSLTHVWSYLVVI